jgi:hypothetical protein
MASAIFDFRISLCRGVFSDDSLDHEFESRAATALGRRLLGVGGMPKRLESRQKTVGCGFFALQCGPVNFALEMS